MVNQSFKIIQCPPQAHPGPLKIWGPRANHRCYQSRSGQIAVFLLLLKFRTQESTNVAPKMMHHFYGRIFRHPGCCVVCGMMFSYVFWQTNNLGTTELQLSASKCRNRNVVFLLKALKAWPIQWVSWIRHKKSPHFGGCKLQQCVI